ncbi:MAG: type II toxin-antitoxin system VapC family toxin [Magnetococcales bacterium]|nr:type II toxin-antitoxin system VapC family toxin [Magnetococcales bacterium]
MRSLNFLLDTNAIIYLHKGLLKDPLPPGRMAISFITEIELRSFPGLPSEQEAGLARFLTNVQHIGLSHEIKETAIRFRRRYRLKIPDALIAASATVHGAVLLTNDDQLHQISELICRRLELTSLANGPGKNIAVNLGEDIINRR